MDHFCECKARDTYLDSILSSAPRRRDQLIPLLQAVQTKFGYVPESAMSRIATHLKISPNQVYGVVTFYAQFRLKPQGKHTLKICQGTACHVSGSHALIEVAREELNIEPGETTDDQEYSMERIACFGACSLAPVVVIDDQVHGRWSEKDLRTFLRQRNSSVASVEKTVEKG